MLKQEELKWRQRAKENWLHDGYRNTKYFHTYTSQKQRRNRINHIVDRLGRNCENEDSVEQAFVDYFQDIFTSSIPNDIDTCTDAIECRLTNSLRASLIGPYTEEEVFRALMQMVPIKAPGRDRKSVV